MISPERNTLNLVRRAAEKKILFLPHAVKQMSRPERMITVEDIVSVVTKGKIIEDYPEDNRGHSCLMLGFGKGNRPIHVVCSPQEDYLAVITAYIPDSKVWKKNFSERRR